MKRVIATAASALLTHGFTGIVASKRAATQPITVHLRECKATYSGDSDFADCHDNPVSIVTSG
jgi:hypothetical protein